MDLHAHPVDEALTLEDDLLPITIDEGNRGDSPFQTEVYLPHPFTFTMMKLFAFRDRIADKNKEYGRYHALDLYAILAMANEVEWNRALELREMHRADSHILEATQIAERYFSSLNSEGMLRMRESPYCRPDLQLEKFCRALQDLFSTRIQSETR